MPFLDEGHNQIQRRQFNNLFYSKVAHISKLDFIADIPKYKAIINVVSPITFESKQHYYLIGN